MHVFLRGVNEGLVIGNDIVVTVLEVRDDHVRLGISVPHGTPAYREEVVYLDETEHSLHYQGAELQLR